MASALWSLSPPVSLSGSCLSRPRSALSYPRSRRVVPHKVPFRSAHGSPLVLSVPRLQHYSIIARTGRTTVLLTPCSVFPLDPAFVLSDHHFPCFSETVLHILRRPRALLFALVEPVNPTLPVPAQVYTVLEGLPFLVHPPSWRLGAKSTITWSAVPLYHFVGALGPGKMDFVGNTPLRTHVYPV